GFLYFFAGAQPLSADTALDLVTVHTHLIRISNNNTSTGLTFEVPTIGVLVKAIAEVWKGVYAFEGFQDGETELPPTFYRFCAGSDNGRGAADPTTGYRVQGSMGGPASGADLRVGSNLVVNAGEQPVGDFSWRF
ncbi:MAG: hypothetical protein JF596_18120, partial [Stenotrophomonas sp.]|nr:hypothetical protein [Stenotrophomonas sp.]